LAALPPAERLGCFYLGLNYCMSAHICISSYNVEVVTDHIAAPDMLFRFLVAKRIFQGRDLYNYELAKLSDSIRQEVITSAVQKCFPYGRGQEATKQTNARLGSHHLSRSEVSEYTLCWTMSFRLDFHLIIHNKLSPSFLTNIRVDFSSQSPSFPIIPPVERLGS
jgi:hypothetical protein